MNLVSDPWIPVVMQEGAPRLVSLSDVFKDGENIADLAANPCQRIALMRLLICIAQAALDGPRDEEDWQTCKSRLASAVASYLDKWRGRFNLFGEHAFLQVDGLDAEPNSLADKIDFTLACGNNPTLFDHGATPHGRVPEAAQLALNLLVFQMFSTCGTIGACAWNGKTTKGTSEHAPCVEGSMLHTFVRQPNLISTIHSNLLTKGQVASLSNATWGLPNWEIEVRSEASLLEMSSSYLGRLLPSSRAINCFMDSAPLTLANGIEYPKIQEFREPSATVVQAGKGNDLHNMYLPVELNKHAWRELGSILSLRQADGQGGAFSLFHLRQFSSDTFDLWTGGVSASKNKILDMKEWSFTLPKDFLDSLVLNRYQSGVETANRANHTLRQAIKMYSELQKSDPVWLAKAELFFWGTLDTQSHELTACATLDDAVLANKWLPIIHTALHAAYERTCPHETPRQIQAYARGLKVLESWKERGHHGA